MWYCLTPRVNSIRILWTRFTMIKKHAPKYLIVYIAGWRFNVNGNFKGIIFREEEFVSRWHQIYLLFISVQTKNNPTLNTTIQDVHYTGSSVYKPFDIHLYHNLLTHWGRDKMSAIFSTTFSNAFSWMKMYEICLIFHWSLFLGFELTIFQHWFR